MGLGHHHGERAFESFLRARRTPYVSVNEARRTLIQGDGAADLKSFDFVVYGATNLLVDIKCRRLPIPATPRLKLVTADGTTRSIRFPAHLPHPRRPRLENWATREDVRSLRAWQELFGPGFKAAFLFIYWSDADNQPGGGQPPDGVFDQVFLFEAPLPRWYAIRGVLLDDYEPAMTERSARWGTVHLPPALFERLSEGFSRRWMDKHPFPPFPPALAAGR